MNGKNFSVGHISKILNNKVYIGKITYKNEEYEGLHLGIIDVELFKQVQMCLQKNKGERKYATNNHQYALLSSKLFDDKGNYMSPTYSYNRHKKRYRYYVSQANIQHKKDLAGSVNKIPGDEIENIVKQEIAAFISNKTIIQPYLNNYALEVQNKILSSLEDLKLNDQIIRLIVHKVTISKDNIELELNKNITIKILENLAYNKEIPINIQDTEFIIIKKDIKIVSTPSHGNKLIIGDEVKYNSTLINAIIKGFYYYNLWKDGKLSYR